MKTFHIDFNTTLFRPEYIVRWLHELAELGFDTLLWEVENAFEWRSCPECAVPDTLPIAELKHLLKVARELGFENIPLFQTLGTANMCSSLSVMRIYVRRIVLINTARQIQR